MNFNKAPDCPINKLQNRYVSEDGTFEIGWYKVMYGWRIRAGYVGSSTLEADYCCQMDLYLLAQTQIACIARLEALPNFSPANVRKALPSGRDKLFRDLELQRELGVEAIA